MKALILTDGKAGHENQSKAFARSNGCEFDILPVKFKSKAAKAFSYLLDNIGIRSTFLFDGLKESLENLSVLFLLFLTALRNSHGIRRLILQLHY